MIYRLVSASILTVWLALLAIGVGDDCGLVKHIREDVDQSLDTVLADFGRAIKISDNSHLAVSAISNGRSVAAYPSLPQQPGILSVPSASLHRGSQETQLLKKPAKLHELRQVFLI